MCYANANYDLEQFEAKYEHHMSKKFNVPTEDDALILKPLMDHLLTL